MAVRPPPRSDPRLDWSTFKRTPGLVLGFHGCDRSVGEAVIAGRTQHLKRSANAYDWLGEGIYFWEWDPWRAMKFATDARANRHLTRGRIQDPYVVGAIIEMGHCLNLLEVDALREVQEGFNYLETAARIVDDGKMPENKGREMGQRFLDRAVIETVHKLRSRRTLLTYDSVRAAFIEGEPLYANAGFNDRNHIQLAVRDVRCIRGYFRMPGL